MWVGVAALILYAALRQHTFYSVDAARVLLESQKGEIAHPYHFLYMPLLALSRAIVVSLGGTMHDAGQWLSVVGVACGVVCAHAAARGLGWSRREAAIVAALVATAPAIVFFGTVVELHGPHFGICGATLLAVAAFVRRPGVRAGIWLGAATGVGYLGHATGALLPAMTLPICAVFVRERGVPARAAAMGLTASVVAHAVVVFGLPPLLHALGGHTTVGGALDHLRSKYPDAVLHDPTLIAHSAWCDWLRPFAPTAIVAALALALPRARLLALALTGAVAVYATVTAVLMGGASERGAYLLPLAWPAALVVVRAIPHAGVLAGLIALSAAIAVADVVTNDVGEDRAFAVGCRDLLGGRQASLLAGTQHEARALLMYPPGIEWDVPPVPLREPADQVAAVFDAWLRQADASGREFWITAGAVEMLGDPNWSYGESAPRLVLEHLRRHCRWEQERSGAFAASRLRLLPSADTSPR